MTADRTRESTQERTTLLPCPFCGCSADLATYSPYIACRSCNTHGPDANGPGADATEAEAIAAWNTRAGMSDPAVEIAHLRKAVDELKASSKNWYDCYMRVADAVAPSSLGPSDLCNQARKTRADLLAAEAEIAKLREALWAWGEYASHECDEEPEDCEHLEELFHRAAALTALERKP